MTDGKPSFDEAAPLVLSKRLVRLTKPGVGDCVANATLELPIEINFEGWKILDLFREPTSPRRAARNAGFGSEELPVFYDFIRRFVSKALLVPIDEERYLSEVGLTLMKTDGKELLSPTSTGFLGASGGSGPADFQFIGVPFDFTSTRTGSAEGAASLRLFSESLPCHVDPRGGDFLGLRDLSNGRNLLSGAWLKDRGDATLDNCFGFEEVFETISETVRHVMELEGLPVFFGGDHSITEPIVRELVARGPLYLVHLDAHSDLGDYFVGTPHHHGNVMQRLLRIEGVRGMLQLGVRDLEIPWSRPPSNVRQIGAEQLSELTPSDVLALVPDDVPCYVSFDIDVLDPAYAPGTGTPIPGGLDVKEITGILTAFGRSRTICGTDIVELAPQHGNPALTNASVVRVLLNFLDAVHQKLTERE